MRRRRSTSSPSRARTTSTGSAFEFNRDYHFNAKNAFATTRDSLRRNTFGGVIGGPMIKNKAFFFGGYQGQIEKTNPPTSISYIPTRAMLSGDFTAIASPACNGGVQRNLTGGFVNNQIDPVAAQPDRPELRASTCRSIRRIRAAGFSTAFPTTTRNTGR